MGELSAFEIQRSRMRKWKPRFSLLRGLPRCCSIANRRANTGLVTPTATAANAGDRIPIVKVEPEGPPAVMTVLEGAAELANGAVRRGLSIGPGEQALPVLGQRPTQERPCWIQPPWCRGACSIRRVSILNALELTAADREPITSFPECLLVQGDLLGVFRPSPPTRCPGTAKERIDVAALSIFQWAR
jgi:hypothetical protein